MSLLFGFGKRGGTRRLKLATTSGGECRVRVGWAENGVGTSVKNGRCDRANKNVTTLTPGAGIRIVDGWVDVSQIDFTHETIDLKRIERVRQTAVQNRREG